MLTCSSRDISCGALARDLRDACVCVRVCVNDWCMCEREIERERKGV